MDETIRRVRSLMDAQGIGCGELAARLDESPSVAYRVDARVLRAALDGRLATPRGCRVLADALRLLERCGGRRTRWSST